METKAEIRKRMRAVRDAIPSDVREAKSRAVCEELLEEARQGAARRCDGDEYVRVDGENAAACGEGVGKKAAAPREGAPFIAAVYAAMGSEVRLDAFVRAAFACGWRVCFPAMVGRTTGPDAVDQPMAFFEVSRTVWEASVAGEQGAGEAPFLDHPARVFDAVAAGFAEVPPCEIDLMVVPMVAFDDAGTRLGYGCGNYDRYLPRLRSAALILGAAFEEQRSPESLPRGEFDIPLARIVTA